MKIYLPNSAFLGNIDPFLRAFNPSQKETLEITANKKWISVHPVVLSMIAALCATLPKTAIICEQLEARSRHYLQRMNLSKYVKLPPERTIKEHEPSGRFIPLTQIRTPEEQTRFIAEITPLLHLKPTQTEPLKYIISELVRNVLEHAQTATGAFVCAQYYKAKEKGKKNIVRIGIADTGVGIKKTITRSHTAKTYLEALRLALTPGITGMTRMEGGTQENAGAGLFFIRSIAKVNKTFFLIYSGNAMYKLLQHQEKERTTLHSDPFKEKHSGGEEYPYWQGTIVGIDIALDQTKAFSDILDAIQTTYMRTIRERKKEYHKRQPRFL